MNKKDLKNIYEKFENMEIKSFARDTIEFIDDSPSTYHVVKNSSVILEENGFERLYPEEKWTLKPNGKYFLKKTNSSIMAFTIGENIDIKKGFKIFGSHTDSPCFRIKPKPEIVTNNIMRLNTEVYGGPILSTWFDRPLSLAGRIVVKGDSAFTPTTIRVNINKPIMTIPNLAIHMNRSVNEGVRIDRQKDVLPVIALINDKLETNNFLLKLLSSYTGFNVEDILDFDLFVYTYEKGCLLGLNEEFVSSPKIDNLVSVYSGLIGLVESNNNNQINVFIGFDNEEIGSATKQGADSNYLLNMLERISLSLGYDRSDFLQMLNCSYMLSSDAAHASHPAHMNKSDPTNTVLINEGVTVKLSARQKYTSDGFSIAVLKQIIDGTDIKIQMYVNESNELGGSTIGPISSTHLEIDSIDVGIPMLAMHSARELCGVHDIYDLKEMAKYFYSKE